MTNPLTQSSIEKIAQSASEAIFRLLCNYTVSDAQLQELAAGIDEAIADFLRETLLDEEEG